MNQVVRPRLMTCLGTVPLPARRWSRGMCSCFHYRVTLSESDTDLFVTQVPVKHGLDLVSQPGCRA